MGTTRPPPSWRQPGSSPADSRVGDDDAKDVPGRPGSTPPPSSLAPTSSVVRQVRLEDGEVFARVSHQPGFVLVCPLQLVNLKAAMVLQEEIERLLAAAACSSMLVDARSMKLASRDVNDCMWHWSNSCPLIVKVAVVNESAVMSVAVEMRAVANGQQQLRGFLDMREAVIWLRDATSTRRSAAPRGRLPGR